MSDSDGAPVAREEPCRPKGILRRERQAYPGRLLPPLDRAAHARLLLRRSFTGLGDLAHRLKQLPAGIGHERGPGRVEPAPVLQFQGGVEAEELGSANRVVGPRHLLGLVDDVGEAEVVLLGETLHLFGCVLRIVHVVVGHDRDYADTPLLQLVFCSSRASRAMRSAIARTYGQWLQMNITSVPDAPSDRTAGS